jgi:hypothetical protein
MIPLSWYVILSAALFSIGVVAFSREGISLSSDVYRTYAERGQHQFYKHSHYLQSLTGGYS